MTHTFENEFSSTHTYVIHTVTTEDGKSYDWQKVISWGSKIYPEFFSNVEQDVLGSDGRVRFKYLRILEYIQTFSKMWEFLQLSIRPKVSTINEKLYSEIGTCTVTDAVYPRPTGSLGIVKRTVTIWKDSNDERGGLIKYDENEYETVTLENWECGPLVIRGTHKTTRFLSEKIPTFRVILYKRDRKVGTCTIVTKTDGKHDAVLWKINGLYTLIYCNGTVDDLRHIVKKDFIPKKAVKTYTLYTLDDHPVSIINFTPPVKI